MKRYSAHLLTFASLILCLLISTGCSEQLVGSNDAPAVMSDQGTDNSSSDDFGSDDSSSDDSSSDDSSSDDSGSDDGNTNAETKIEASLTSTSADPLASGNAKFEVRSDRVKFSTEVEDVSTNGLGSVQVLRGTQVILRSSISISLGFGDLNLDSRLGDTVPTMSLGDQVSVFDAAGTMILSGTF